jgi:hypothetical protein
MSMAVSNNHKLLPKPLHLVVCLLIAAVIAYGPLAVVSTRFWELKRRIFTTKAQRHQEMQKELNRR